MIDQFRLPLNNTPLNQAALRWLEQAKAQRSPSLLYLTQLAFWGLEKGVQVQSEVPPEALQDQVSLLLAVKANAAKEQGQAYQWLLSNPDGPSQAEQTSTLEKALRSAPDPLQAAAAVLETVSDRMAAASASNPE